MGSKLSNTWPYQKVWQAKNPGKRRATVLKWKFKLTPERHTAMLIEQSNRCAICSVEFSHASRETTPCVDHNHECCSGIKSCGKCIRGLICRKCNEGLGSFRDNTETLRNAIQYLNKFRELVA